jgi:DnaJ like chaperone protein
MSETKKTHVDPFSSTEEEQHQKQVFIATFSMLAKLTGADGNISANEIQIIDRFMKEVLSLDDERRKYAISLFNKARKDDLTFEHYARRYYELLSAKPKMLEWMLDILLRVSLVDREFDQIERDLVETARTIFKISIERYRELEARYLTRSPAAASADGTSELTAAFKTLRLDSSASAEEILTRHRELSVEYTPSRIIELGLPEEFVRLAETLYGEIQEAFQVIKKERGMR